jgi:threonine/homoserine/homoserine lactone efflux protein
VTIDLVLLALCISLEPIPLTGYILTLSTKNGTRNGFGFLVGWVLSLAGVIVLTLAVTGGKPLKPSTVPSNAVLIAKIVFGVALLIFAWRYRQAPEKEHSQPGWMSKMDSMKMWTAAVLAFLLQPWGLVAGAALTITAADASKGSDLATLIVFCVLATISLVAMEGYAILAPEASRARLDGLRSWMDTHRRSMVVYLSAAVGILLITRGTVSLTS